MITSNETFDNHVQRSNELRLKISSNPSNFRMLTGDRPTGRLHIGHLFGSLLNRVKLQDLGVETYVVIADYQVLTDREEIGAIQENVRQLVIDYLAVGIDPNTKGSVIFPHSYVPELNQLLIPFLTLVSNAELNRNPTVKDEIQVSGLASVNAGMYVYPVHQAADILFCKATVVPVGKDQLPHLEMARTIARRFNDRFAPLKPTFPEPAPLLSSSPLILGLDGSQKMSKSRNNTIMLSFSEDQTASAIKGAKTDPDRNITYDPECRPEVANLLMITSLCTGKKPEEIAMEIGGGGASKLKSTLTDALNEFLRPIRYRRKEIERDKSYIDMVLRNGVEKAREVAVSTLTEVQQRMSMKYY